MPGPLIAGIAGSVGSALIQKSSADKAAGAQAKASNQQIAETRRQFDLIQGLLKPYVTAGTGALQGQLDLMGIGGNSGTIPGVETITGRGVPNQYKVGTETFATEAEAKAAAEAQRTGVVSAADAQRGAIDGLANGENFKALVQQGEYGLMANSAATGGLRGGNTQGALAQYHPAMLQGLIDRQLASLGGLAANGQGAAAMTGTAAQNAGAQINQAIGDRGAARAGAALAGGQAFANAGAGILNTVGMMAQPMTPGGGAWQKWTF